VIEIETVVFPPWLGNTDRDLSCILQAIKNISEGTGDAG